MCQLYQVFCDLITMPSYRRNFCLPAEDSVFSLDNERKKKFGDKYMYMYRVTHLVTYYSRKDLFPTDGRLLEASILPKIATKSQFLASRLVGGGWGGGGGGGAVY